MSESRLRTIFVVVERSDHRCGDDLVTSSPTVQPWHVFEEYHRISRTMLMLMDIVDIVFFCWCFASGAKLLLYSKNLVGSASHDSTFAFLYFLSF